MLEIIVLVIILLGVWYIGALFGWQAHDRMLRRNIRYSINEFEEYIEDTYIKIKIEKHNDMLYVYDNTTHAFMAQGKTRKDIEQELQNKFPGKRFAAQTEEISLLGTE
jgi:hypothetical protein